MLAEAPFRGPILVEDEEGARLFRLAQQRATEHVIWAAAAGQHPNDVLAAIRSRRITGDWEIVRTEVALAQLALLREREAAE